MPLYIISTPIGNLADLSPRAIQTLQAATLLACEDTRSARRLLSAFHIPAEGKHLVSYGEHNETAMAQRLVLALQQGQAVALISEGGTRPHPGSRAPAGAVLAEDVFIQELHYMSKQDASVEAKLHKSPESQPHH